MIYFNNELTAIESCKSVSQYEKRPPDSGRRSNNNNDFTSSCLQTSSDNKVRICVYCKSSDHLASRCNSVTNVSSKKTILSKQGRCFVCLPSRHKSI